MTPTPEEQKKFEEVYAKMKAYIGHRKGPAIALACQWHLEEVKVLEAQIKNMQEEFMNLPKRLI